MKKQLIAVYCLLIAGGGFSQDLNFSQFYEQPLLRNPALCGLFNGNLRVGGIFRNQWPSLHVPYRTQGLSIETRAPFCGDNSGCENYWTIGGQFTYDVAGDSRLTRSQGMLAIGRRLTLSCDRGDALIVSFVPGFVNSHFDPTKLRWDDEYVNGTYTPGSTNQVLKRTGITYGELGAGLLYTSPISEDASFYIGGSVYHLLLFSLSSSSSGFNINSNKRTTPNVKYSINGGMEMRVNQQQLNLFGDYILQNAIRPSNDSAIALRAGRYSTVMAGALLTLNPKDGTTQGEDATSFSIGAMYRWNDALAPIVRIEHKTFSFGISYDINISGLTVASKANGGLELTLGYRLNNCPYSSTICPKF